MTHLNSLHNLYIHQLKDLYSAEQQILQSLPKMAQAASSPDLKGAFQHHLAQSQMHVDRLNTILRELGENPGGIRCKGMEGLLAEGDETLQMDGHSATKDAALIAAAQRVEHYEIAGYGAVRTYADLLGYNDAANMLQTTLNEEGEADKTLTGLAEGGLFTTGINEQAANK